MSYYLFKSFEILHKIPERGFCEEQTSKFIGDELTKLGMEVRRGVGGTGVVAVYDSGVPGPVVALRADMDALEFEIGGRSVLRHACGHDAHSAMVLSATKEIVEGGIRRGKFYSVFQPAEELGKGALAMIDSGEINEVEEMFGIHLRPYNEKPLGRATCALVHNSSYKIIARIRGRLAHGARPHLGINAAEAAVAAVNGVNSIRLDPGKSYSAKVTRIRTGGNSLNTIPDDVELAFDLRAESNSLMKELLEKTKKAIRGGAETLGAVAEFTDISGIPAAEYSEEMVEVAREAVAEVLGECDDLLMTAGGEDFHFFSKKANIKTAYIGLGADLRPGLHDPDMTFDKNSLVDGKEILKRLVIKRLG